MPQMNGIELARRFQDIFPDAKIMLMSGFTEESEVRRAFPAPGIGFLPKPLLLQKLAEKVREVLNQ